MTFSFCFYHLLYCINQPYGTVSLLQVRVRVANADLSVSRGNIEQALSMLRAITPEQPYYIQVSTLKNPRKTGNCDTFCMKAGAILRNYLNISFSCNTGFHALQQHRVFFL